jgi:hypothetical protein
VCVCGGVSCCSSLSYIIYTHTKAKAQAKTYVQRLAREAVAADNQDGHGELGGGVRLGEGELGLGRREEGVGGLCGCMYVCMWVGGFECRQGKGKKARAKGRE